MKTRERGSFCWRAIPRILFTSAAIAWGIVGWADAAENWTEFRGPDGQGHSQATSLPLRWSPTENIRWKADIPGRGWSSPVVYNGRVYLTTAIPGAGPDAKRPTLTALCLDANTGKIAWTVDVFPFEEGPAAQNHQKNSYASPTPVTDGKHLFVHFGAQGTACLTLDGEVVWKTRELEYQPQHGSGSSPVLVDDVLVFPCDGSDVDFVVALDQSNGKIRWKKERPPVQAIKKFSFATPLVIEVEGRKQIISPGAHSVVAYSPADGNEIWQVRYTGYSVVPRPVFGNGLVYLCTGFDSPSLLAIRPTGQGDVTDSHVAWHTNRSVSLTPSPLLVGNELYFINDGGVATCVDAKTGKVHWTHRVGGKFSASPLHSQDRIYFQSETGETTVIEAGRKYQELARNQMEAATLASFGVVDHALLLRTENTLYRIEER